MKEGKNSLYALYNTKGQRYTKDMYKAYTPFEGGYLVTDANDQTGYISNTGKICVLSKENWLNFYYILIKEHLNFSK